MFKVTCFPKPTYYLYALVCPIYKEIKYIGLSKNPELRFYNHLKAKGEGKRKNEWIIKLKELGLNPELLILNSYKNRKFASEEEERYINENRSTLLNGAYSLKYPVNPSNRDYESMYNVNMTMTKDTLSKLEHLGFVSRNSKENVIAKLISDKYHLITVDKKIYK